VAFSALLVVLVAVAMLLLVRARPSADPFDPRSGAPDGTRGLVLLLEQYGADVDVVRSVPDVSSGRRVLVLQDRLTDDERAALQGYAAAGGVVVMADPESPLAAPAADIAITGTVGDASAGALEESNVLLGTCDITALQHLRGLFVAAGVLLEARAEEPACFGGDGLSFVVARPAGTGVIVALGDNSLFTNRFLRFADNAGLATALLAPVGGTKVSIVLGDAAPKTAADIGTGDRSLFDLIRPGVWMALAQLALAFVVVAWARAVRPGRPVREPEQPPIAGSELVVATGSLMQRAHHAPRAAQLLRDRLHVQLCEQYRLPPGTSVESVDATVASRTSLQPGQVAEVLRREVRDQQQLLQLSNRIQEIRDLVLEGADR
jgi:hypothetical protein